MYHSKSVVHQLAKTLLEELSVKNPTPEQYQAAASFASMVLLPSNQKSAVQDTLTATEWLCLNLAASGFSIKKTAKELSLTPNTIKNYRERIRQKLQCNSITQAVYKAFVSPESSD